MQQFVSRTQAEQELLRLYQQGWIPQITRALTTAPKDLTQVLEAMLEQAFDLGASRVVRVRGDRRRKQEYLTGDYTDKPTEEFALPLDRRSGKDRRSYPRNTKDRRGRRLYSYGTSSANKTIDPDHAIASLRSKSHNQLEVLLARHVPVGELLGMHIPPFIRQAFQQGSTYWLWWDSPSE